MSYDLTDILKPAGTNPGAGGGIKSIIFAILASDVLSLPDRGEDLVTMTGDISMKTGKYIHQIYATPKTIEQVCKKLKGENRDSGGFEISVPFFHPGLEAAILEFQAKHSNSDFYILIKNCPAKKVYLVGEECNSVWMDDFESKWGKDIGDGKGTTFTFLSHQSLPLAIYQGELDGLLVPDEEDSGSGSGSGQSV